VETLIARPAADPGWRKSAPAIELVLLLGVVFFFWEGKAFTPLRLLVVFLHDASHALVVLLTGGQVGEMVVNARHGDTRNLASLIDSLVRPEGFEPPTNGFEVCDTGILENAGEFLTVRFHGDSPAVALSGGSYEIR